MKIEIPRPLQMKIYLSLFWVIIILSAITLGLYYLDTATGIYTLIIIVPMALALFFTSKPEGKQITKDKHPKVFKLIEEVSQEIGMKPPKRIFITPTDSIGVQGIFSKTLILGIGALRIINTEELKSIIAHEMGHLYGKDTIIGALIWKMNMAISASTKFGEIWFRWVPLLELALIGLVLQLFFVVYAFIFNLFVFIFNRQIEYRADYIAAKLYSPELFSEALIKISAYSYYFAQVGYPLIANLALEEKVLNNSYETFSQDFERQDVKAIRKAAIANDHIERSLFDSHPTLLNRLKAITSVESKYKQKRKVKSSITLFDGYEKIEKEMSIELAEGIKQNVINQIVADAQAREGKCKHCGKQFKTVAELLDHENSHAQK